MMHLACGPTEWQPRLQEQLAHQPWSAAGSMNMSLCQHMCMQINILLPQEFHGKAVCKADCCYLVCTMLVLLQTQRVGLVIMLTDMQAKASGQWGWPCSCLRWSMCPGCAECSASPGAMPCWRVWVAAAGRASPALRPSSAAWSASRSGLSSLHCPRPCHSNLLK